MNSRVVLVVAAQIQKFKNKKLKIEAKYNNSNKNYTFRQ